jgi:hypothetical protein
MDKTNKNYLSEDHIKDTQQKAKSRDLFRKLLAKQKLKADPFQRAS